jgi:polysaccharide deacetylase family protein (PEP-CTERM system associated)
MGLEGITHPPRQSPRPTLNAMSVDLEDWFCVHNLSGVLKAEDWDQCELRVNESARRLLGILERHSVTATFFVLGWVAERLPDLIREIELRNHEIAIHGYSHHLITQMSPEEFEDDLARAIRVLQRCGVNQQPIGFRAPSFTIVEKTMWALEILQRYGIRYDSSVFPVGFHPDYGIPTAPLDPYRITDQLLEFPMTCVEILGRRIPCGGGGYFRLLPYAYTRYCLQKVNDAGRPAVFYLHPWELDPDQPRVTLPLLKRLRHYVNLNRTEMRLNSLLRDFRFTTVRDVLGL